MPATKNLDEKYLIFHATKLIVKIDHINYQKEFRYRDHGGFQNTKQKAIKHRDEIFLEKTGNTISKSTTHFKSRTSNPDLEPGLSLGYVNGTLHYVVVSYSKEVMGNPSKIRYNIKKLGYKEALRLGREKLHEIKSQNNQ